MIKPEQHHRPIRSFVLREGRLTQGQRRAFDRLWPQVGVDFRYRSLDLPALFGNPNPIHLEIGFGNGESIARMAESTPENNYLGIEVHRPGVGRLLQAIDERGLTNLRIVRHDAVEVLAQGIEDASLAAVYLFFPDPWHKRRHHKRRILQTEFVAHLARVLRPGGIFHAATDWEEYAEHMLSTMTSADEFDNCGVSGRFAPRPAYRVLTRFEKRGQNLGHGVWDLIFQRT
ncbi:MAG: tRNA (guanosine(46)-N7)-methyltransferase TrmB [Gammaproteobacteria bacterium]|nr:tRNA (guanosine(46)-N7)-methyltransferase TrmB [Gammaproteobacteria bacterium]